MSKAGKERPPLVEAAERLETALTEYQKTVHELLRLELDSRRGVERAARVLVDIHALDQQLAGHVTGLVGIIATLRDRQQGDAEAVEKRAVDIAGRKQLLDALLQRLSLLAEGVKQVAALFEAVRAQGGSAGEGLAEAVGSIDTLAEASQAFATDAQTAGFADLAAEGQALRQQLLYVKNKVQLLDRKLD
ncbi:MAG TPA: hypothetical protein VL172_02795 [Kofleriaceae bacterium]|nr:hypothetical protein [Kofleriaceae bacterium]